MVKLVQLLADRDRLALLPEIVTAYRERLMEREKVIRVEVVHGRRASGGSDCRAPASDSRSRPDDDPRTSIWRRRVDPSIIGGAITKIGSTVYDGSVTRQLEKMKETLVAGVT